MKRSAGLIALFAFVFLTSMASAQGPDFMSPQPEHKLLERFAGKWRYEKWSASDDGSEPKSIGSGEVTSEPLGNFFVINRWQGQDFGMDVSALQTLGYDVIKKQYSGSWIDSFLSYRWEFSGAVDDASRELVVTASGPSPGGGTCKFRERYQFESADSIKIIAEMEQDAKWAHFMTTHLKRSEK